MNKAMIGLEGKKDIFMFVKGEIYLANHGYDENLFEGVGIILSHDNDYKIDEIEILNDVWATCLGGIRNPIQIRKCRACSDDTPTLKKCTVYPKLARIMEGSEIGDNTHEVMLYSDEIAVSVGKGYVIVNKANIPTLLEGMKDSEHTIQNRRVYTERAIIDKINDMRNSLYGSKETAQFIKDYLDESSNVLKYNSTFNTISGKYNMNKISKVDLYNRIDKYWYREANIDIMSSDIVETHDLSEILKRARRNKMREFKDDPIFIKYRELIVMDESGIQTKPKKRY